MNVCYPPVRSLLVGTVAALLPHVSLAQVYPLGFVGETLSTQLSNPSGLAVDPEGSVYFIQQGGQLRRWREGLPIVDVHTFTTTSSGERGLIGFALAPDFQTSRQLYVHHTRTQAPIGSTIRRVTLNAAGTSVVGGSEVELLYIGDSTSPFHRGGGMHFGPDGKIYVGVGDNLVSANSQGVNNLFGKLLRLNPDPSDPIPSDNPSAFAGIEGTPTGVNRAIWAVGLRNPFSFAFQPYTGRMFINDVGALTYEEVNEGQPGRNFGWPTTEGPFDPSAHPNFTHPLLYYHHTDPALNGPPGNGSYVGQVVIAPVFYNTVRPNFPVEYQGKYFFGDTDRSFIRWIDPSTGVGAEFASGVLGLVAMTLDREGRLLYLRHMRSGGVKRVIRLRYSGANGACCDTDLCQVSNGSQCMATFHWGTLSCTPNPCVASVGACCAGASCVLLEATACAGPFRAFVGPSTACNAVGNHTLPCCRADFTQNGQVGVQDLFDYLAAYFSNDVEADVNGGGTTVQDLFDFLGAWFVGCV